MDKKTKLLMILDGVGINNDSFGNAYKLANTPNLDKLMIKYKNSTLKTSGLAVGLPEGQMGNSEVGHTNIGAGRVVYQELTRISKEIKEDKLKENEAIKKAMINAKENNKALHLMGLVSSGGVHSHIEHLYALIKLAKEYSLTKVYIHAFLDGRDVGPSTGIDFLKNLEDKTKEIGIGKIVSIIGRYYAMDRDKRYERLEMAYNMMVNGEGNKFKSIQRAIENSYEAQEFDEFVKPIIVTNEKEEATTIKNGDSCIFFNFRPDRAREITHILTDDKYEGFERKNKPNNLTFITMTPYDATLQNVEIAYKKQAILNTLGEFASNKGLTQLRIAETEKYAHVTFFFNGGNEVEYKGEDRILIPSPKVATYDLKPEMSALEITDKVIEAIESKKYDLIIMNYANGDMVGHTGVLEKAIEAVETVDKCVGRVVSKLEELGGEAVITADHGNCEYMIDAKTSEIITAHSTFDVPVIIVSDRIETLNNGALCDIAPTMLTLLGIEKPNEMTGKSLITLK